MSCAPSRQQEQKELAPSPICISSDSDSEEGGSLPPAGGEGSSGCDSERDGEPSRSAARLGDGARRIKTTQSSPRVQQLRGRQALRSVTPEMPNQQPPLREVSQDGSVRGWRSWGSSNSEGSVRSSSGCESSAQGTPPTAAMSTRGDAAGGGKARASSDRGSLNDSNDTETMGVCAARRELDWDASPGTNDEQRRDARGWLVSKKTVLKLPEFHGVSPTPRKKAPIDHSFPPNLPVFSRSSALPSMCACGGEGVHLLQNRMKMHQRRLTYPGSLCVCGSRGFGCDAGGSRMGIRYPALHP